MDYIWIVYGLYMDYIWNVFIKGTIQHRYLQRIGVDTSVSLNEVISYF